MSERSSKWLARAYIAICASLVLAYFGVIVLNAFGVTHVTDADLKAIFDSLWNATIGSIADPALRVLIYIVLGAVVIILIPGVFGAAIWLCIVLLGLTVFVEIIQVLVTAIIALARVSVTGAIVAAVLSAGLLCILFRLFQAYAWSYVWRFLRPVAEALYGIFLDWWLTPLLRRRKEKRIMDEVRGKRDRYEHAIAKLKTEYPEVADIVPLSPNSEDTWIERVIERFHDRGRQKNREEKIKLAAQARQFYAEYRGAIDEYRGVLEAQDDLERVKTRATFKEKDEEAKLRELDRKKRRLALEKEIQELERVPERPAEPDKRSSEEIKLGKLADADRREADAVAACNGDQEQVSRVKRVFEDLRMRIMEER